MASLIHLISSIDAARYGVNILELRPPGEVQGESTNVVGSVADLPWGPVDTVTLITSPAELFDTFAPAVFGSRHDLTHAALLAYVNKTFPASMKIVRTANTGQATAAFTFLDNDPAASVDATARHPGLLGNQISVAWSVNADDAAARDMTVTIAGSTYSVTYLAVATIVATDLVVTDPGDPFVGVAANGAGDEVPEAIAATPLAGGLDGAAVIGDYLGSVGVGRGLEEYAAGSVDVDVLFGAEIPQTLVGGWNTGLKAFMDNHEKGFGVLSTDSTITTKSGAITDTGGRRKDRLSVHYPRVKTVNTYDPNRAEIVVDGNAFAAVVIASVPPEAAPGGANSAEFLTGITALDPAFETIDTNGYKSLNDAGIAPWFNSTANQGFIIHRAFTTSLISGEERIFRRRMTDFIMLSIAASAETFAEQLLDLDLPNKALGPNTSIQVGLWNQFLTDLANPDAPRIRGYELDAFGSNLQANIDAGQWKVAISVKLISAQEELVFLATIGERVELAQAA